jgi:polysaccharide deacetylase 2 family uncharacterized protein YibQ
MPSSGGRSGRRGSSGKKRDSAWWRSSSAWIAIALLLLLVTVWWLVQPGDTGPSGEGDGLDAELRSLADRHGVAADGIEADIEIRKINGVFVRSWSLLFPDAASRQEFIAELSILADRESVTVGDPKPGVGRTIGVRIDHGIEAFQIELRVTPKRSADRIEKAVVKPSPKPATPTVRPEPPPGARGRLAVLLDDAGQQMHLARLATSLPDAVGIAVLPFLPYSTESAVELHESGHEVWLHLPMEAVSGKDPGPGALMVAMSVDELHDAVFMAINNIPHLVGVNNHMGSLATANLKMMTWVMQDLAAMDLAFLDSRTTVATVAEEAARAQGVKTGRRHVFLDNERTKGAIRAQLDEAVYRARMEGEIIAIGHLTEVTVDVLAEELPGLDERGVSLVRPTALMR